jgi:Flp pilus assembly protein TadG
MAIRQPQRKRRGATTVEAALLLAPLILIVFSIFEYGFLLMNWNLINNAAREGCRYAVVNNTSGTVSTNVQTIVNGFMAGQSKNFNSVTVTVSGTHLGVSTSVNNLVAGDLLTVKVSGALLVGFLALAIDLGMLAVAKAQAQQAADLASLTAARTVNGNPTGSYNKTTATTNAQNILTHNVILGQAIQSSQLVLTYGSYDYNQATQTFNANYPATARAPYTAFAATITANNLRGGFSAIFGSSFLPTITATAQAVHCPRDVALVLDLSGSMRFGTTLGFDFYTPTRTTNNPDANVPTFGQYSSANAGLIGPSSNRTSGFDSNTISPSNTTAPNASYSLTYINSFYQSAPYASTLVRAFDSWTSTNGGQNWTPSAGLPQQPAPGVNTVTPVGDVPLFANGSTTTYATDVKDVFNSISSNPLWELDGYSGFTSGQPDTSVVGVPQVWTQADYTNTPFNGYTKGPGYYGKTFFLWPLDPRNTNTLSGTALTSYLSALGINAADQTVLSNIWPTWQGQGSTGLTNLQNWLKGTAKGGASSLPNPVSGYTPASATALVPSVTTWNGTALTAAAKPRTYYAVCRLFNRAYPGGAAWTSTSFSADWRVRFFGTNDNTKLFNGSGSLNSPGSSGMCANLQRDPDLARADKRSLPDAAVCRPDQVLRSDSGRDHRKLAELRRYGPTLLG